MAPSRYAASYLHTHSVSTLLCLIVYQYKIRSIYKQITLVVCVRVWSRHHRTSKYVSRNTKRK